MCSLRIGHGYDVHRLVSGRPLILGGVAVEHKMGLLGHSDADVCLHAIMDAILGALALGDIGRHFPDTAKEYEGISSMHLLSRVYAMMRERSASIENLDVTLIAQKPKLLPYIPRMIENIAFALRANPSAINLKATTEEHLGFTGSELGIAAHAVVLLKIEK
ncbi:MAG: 2-C-methyl-D-erythritol 2,4-cyclodiphosphate synthase [Clostridia bacterium]|nr:2-C-methyl-D-erythritol 2,4-cyclodiphosphate synthase [Clostridia bacterium]